MTGVVTAGFLKAFKTKHRFGLHLWGDTTRSVPLVDSIFDLLSARYWVHLHWEDLPNWGKAAQSALELFLPLMALLPLLAQIQRLQPLAKRYGIDINVTVARYKTKCF